MRSLSALLPRSVAYSVEFVLKHQISVGGAYLDCYKEICTNRGIIQLVRVKPKPRPTHLPSQVVVTCMRTPYSLSFWRTCYMASAGVSTKKALIIGVATGKPERTTNAGNLRPSGWQRHIAKKKSISRRNNALLHLTVQHLPASPSPHRIGQLDLKGLLRWRGWQLQPKVAQWCNNLSQVNLSGYVGHATIYLVECSLLRAVS